MRERPVTCRAPGCTKSTAHSSRGLCSMHRSRLARHGTLEPQGVGQTHGNPEARFLRFLKFASVAHEGSPCVRWCGGFSDTGYGSFSGEGRKRTNAHRWAYEHWVGPVAKGLHLDHLCRNRWCVNPQHLEPVAPRENWARGDGPLLAARLRAATHCSKGHEFTEANTYVSREGRRTCRACRRERQARFRARQRRAA